MPELDFFVGFPQAVPGTGDTVLYSTRASTRPLVVGPVQSGERAMNHIFGWFSADQDATVKLQGWDIRTAAWVTLNNNGAGTAAPAAGGPANMSFDLPGGDIQIVVNFPVAPGQWNVPSSWRLSKRTT